ncbi:hypothetical protein TNCV_2369301 [Trichonephila clavipes]|nr:hypothetical protein TNCV_2369301 [Trichonephila clavipes]
MKDPQSVLCACQDGLESPVEWMRANVEAAGYPQKYKQPADEQLSPFVLSQLLEVTPQKENINVRSGDYDGHRTGVPIHRPKYVMS